MFGSVAMEKVRFGTVIGVPNVNLLDLEKKCLHDLFHIYR